MAELTETLNQARTDILNLLAEFDAVVEGREGEGKYEPDSEDAAVVEDIRQRWIGGFGDTRPSGLTGYPDYEATDPPENDDVPLSAAEIDALQHPRCVSCGQPAHAWTPDGRGLCLRTSCQPEADMMANDSVINELRDFAECIRRENRNRRTILKALDARVRYLQGVATQTVDVSGASATMQAGGVPRRGQDLPDATLVRSASDMTSAALDSGAAAELRWPCGGWRGYPTPESE